MKKALITLLALVVVVGGAAWYFISFRMDSMIESQIEAAATQSFGTSVNVGGVHTDIKGGSLTISSVTVANPPGFNNEHAFKLNQIEAAVDYSTLEIKRVIIDQPDIVIEEIDGKTNFDRMLASLNEGGGGKAPSDQGEAGDGSAGGAEEPVIVIRHFRMNESRAAFESKSMDKYTDLKVDSIELRDVRGTPSEVANVIAREVLTEVSKEAGLEMLKAKASDKLDEFLGRDRD